MLLWFVMPLFAEHARVGLISVRWSPRCSYWQQVAHVRVQMRRPPTYRRIQSINGNYIDNKLRSSDDVTLDWLTADWLYADAYA